MSFGLSEVLDRQLASSVDTLAGAVAAAEVMVGTPEYQALVGAFQAAFEPASIADIKRELGVLFACYPAKDPQTSSDVDTGGGNNPSSSSLRRIISRISSAVISPRSRSALGSATASLMALIRGCRNDTISRAIRAAAPIVTVAQSITPTLTIVSAAGDLSKELKDNNTTAIIMRLADLYDRLADRAETRGDRAVQSDEDRS